MLTIEPRPGQRISEVARLLVANAPARAVFNDITIRAKYATTNPADVVREYDRRSELRSIASANSPAGKALKAEGEAQAALARSQWAACEAELPTLDFADVAAVLGWVERAAGPADHVAVTYDRAAVVEVFRRGGWTPNANVGADFDEGDARNFAGWVVGQWLVGYPHVTGFVEEWRRRFAGEAPARR